MGTNFDLAPPAVVFDGSKTAVPIEISEIDAWLTFDSVTHNAHGDATISFVVDLAAGRPIFSVHQTVTSA